MDYHHHGKEIFSSCVLPLAFFDVTPSCASVVPMEEDWASGRTPGDDNGRCKYSQQRSQKRPWMWPKSKEPQVSNLSRLSSHNKEKLPCLQGCFECVYTDNSLPALWQKKSICQKKLNVTSWSLCTSCEAQLCTDPPEWAPGYSAESSARGWSSSKEAAHCHECSKALTTSASSSGVCTSERVRVVRVKNTRFWPEYKIKAHFFWLCMDKVTFVLSNSMLALCGMMLWNCSTSSVWMNSVPIHSEQHKKKPLNMTAPITSYSW